MSRAEQLFADSASALRRQVLTIVGDAQAAEDIVQDVFVRIIERQDSLRDERLAAWLHRVARNAAIDHLRAARPVPLEAEPAAPSEVEVEADLTGLASYVADQARKLPQPYAEAIRLTEIDGLSQREAAGRLGISYSAMKSRVQRGRQKLLDALTQCCEIEVDRRGKPFDYTCNHC